MQGVYQFQLTVTDNDGATATDVMQVTVEDSSGSLLPAVYPSNTVNGLDYAYYETGFKWGSVPDLSDLDTVKTGTVSNFNISPANRTMMFSFNFTGFIDVPSDGQYTFYTTSDDGSLLYIDSILVVNNDGYHSAGEQSGTIGLKAGKHAIAVGYSQLFGESVLNVSYAGPDISKQAIPDSLLYRISLQEPDSNFNKTLMNNSSTNQPKISNSTGNQAKISTPQVGVKAYPNPFSNYITVNITGDAGDYKLIIMDAAGKTIFTKSSTKSSGSYEVTINTSNFRSGSYFVKVIQNNTSSVIQLVK